MRASCTDKTKTNKKTQMLMDKIASSGGSVGGVRRGDPIGLLNMSVLPNLLNMSAIDAVCRDHGLSFDNR